MTEDLNVPPSLLHERSTLGFNEKGGQKYLGWSNAVGRCKSCGIIGDSVSVSTFRPCPKCAGVVEGVVARYVYEKKGDYWEVREND